MARQHIDFKGTGSVGDSGEDDAASVRPVEDLEWATTDVTNRPTENLRLRTEILRNAADELTYLADVASAQLLMGGGTVTWYGLSDPVWYGCFDMTDDIIARPVKAPPLCTPARVVHAGIRFTTYSTGSGGGVPIRRAYSGANRISVSVTGAAGGSIGATVDGTPADNLHLQVSTTSTRNAVIAFVNAAPVFQNVGVRAELVETADGAGVWDGGLDSIPLYLQLAGAVDAERHVVTSSGILSFFLGDDNRRLQEGDVIGIAYDDLVLEGSYGGRRQSIAELPEMSSNCDSNLFNLRLNPERAPFAIPLASVQGGRLVFSSGLALSPGQTSTLVFNTNGTTIFYDGSGNWKDGTRITAGTISYAVDRIVSDLAGATGAAKIGMAAVMAPGGGTLLPAGSIQDGFENLKGAVPLLGTNNTFTGYNHFEGDWNTFGGDTFAAYLEVESLWVTHPIQAPGLVTTGQVGLLGSGSVLSADVEQKGSAGSSTTYPLIKGYQTGLVKYNGSVTFPIAYPTAPVVRISGGILYEGRAGKWSGGSLPYAMSCAVEPHVTRTVTPTGFTVLAQLRAHTTTTYQTEFLGGEGATYVTGTPGATGGASQTVLAAAGAAYDNLYTLEMEGTLSCIEGGDPPSTPSSVRARASFVFQALISGTWTTVATWTSSWTPYVSGGTQTISVNKISNPTIPGVTSSTRFRVVNTDVEMTSSGGSGIRVRHAEVSFRMRMSSAVSYTRILVSGDTHTAPMTPDPNHWLTWEAWLP